MITPISRTNIDLIAECAPGLVRALEKTSLGEHWDIPALYDYLANFEAYAFLQHESGYSGVFQITGSPKVRTLYFFWSGKNPDNDVPIDYAEVDQFLIAAAQNFGCQQISCEGREGWGKVIAPLGYKADSRTYIKEVPHDSTQV